MSFRNRLGLFFILLVAIPMAAIAILAADVTGDAQAGKADARLSVALEAALRVYEDQREEAKDLATELLIDPKVLDAIRSQDSRQIEEAAGTAGREVGLESLTIVTPDGAELKAMSSRNAVATARVSTTGTEGPYEFVASVAGENEYVQEVSRLTGLEVILAGPQGARASTAAGEIDPLPASGDSLDTEIAGRELRAAAAALGEDANRVVVISEVESGGFLDSRPAVALLVVVFVGLALALIAVLFRTLQGQIDAMLNVARRIGSGDFSQRVPVVGGDEMAGLATEFNSMSDRLEAQITQLRRQRDELTQSARRLGKAGAEGLDRDALMATFAETALSACAAEYVRVALADGTLIERPRNVTGSARDAADAGAGRASREGIRVAAKRGDGHALAAPLGRDADLDGSAIAVARRGEPFDGPEREMFLYLLDQAAASMRNISTHERVSEQAVTDELTGLQNSRAFRETAHREAERALRFDHPLSLIILDLDDFKAINDTHGHAQGDEVLRAVGRVLASEPRAIDEAARYGGEEFVVALPETDAEGAVEVAERIRVRLESERIPNRAGGEPLRVTASFGTATMPGSADDVRDLFVAADQALYRAKRSGKNRVVAAKDTTAQSK
ncbi:MAG: diguanylate cyclase [Actinomycetota bacterium]|nr:diguanylate cyclase [Actinomycetota bacterium]